MGGYEIGMLVLVELFLKYYFGLFEVLIMVCEFRFGIVYGR